MAHSIKVNADVSGVRKDIMALSKDIEKGVSGNKKLQLFDRDTRTFIERGAQDAIKGMQAEAKKLEEANKKILEVLKSQATKEDEMRKKQQELIRNKRKLLEIEKDITKTKTSSDDILGQGTKAGQFKSGFKGAFGGAGDILSKIPGIGGILKGAMGAGGGMMGMMGGLAGGAALGLGGLAIGRSVNGFNTFDQNKDSMIKLMGRGYSSGEASMRDDRFNKIGMNAEDVRGLRLQSVDTFGRKGSSPDAMLKTATTARGLGIGSDQLMGAGQGLRAQLGLSGGQKAFAKLQATLISTELDGAIGPFLETTANMLTQINENGIGLDSAALAVMSRFGDANGMSPEMTQKIFTNLDDSVKGATGENAAFMMSALTSAGIGAGSLGGAQVAMSQGLFGGDAEKLRSRGNIPKAELDELQSQGIISDDSKEGAQAFQKRAGAISGMYGKVTTGMGASGKALVASKLTGIKDPLAAREAMGLLEKASQGDLTKKDQKRLNDLSKSPEDLMKDRLNEIANSTAGQLEISQKFKADMSEALGEQLAPLGIIANKFLANIDAGISYLAGLMGFQSSDSATGFADRAGMGNATAGELAQMSPDDYKVTTEAMKKELEQSVMREQYGSSLTGKITGAVMGQPVIGGGKENLFSLNPKEEKQRQDRLIELMAEGNRQRAQMLRQAQKPKNTQISGSGKTGGTK